MSLPVLSQSYIDTYEHYWTCLDDASDSNKEAVQDRILYVELNAVRAGMVKRPEQWKWGTARWRLTGNDQDLIPLDELFPADPGTDVYSGYRTRLYYRGAVPNRYNQAAIPRWILHQEQRRGYTRAGAFRRGLRFLKDGLAVGPAENVAQATGELNVVLRELTQTVQMQSACDGFCSAPAGSEAVSLSDCSGARWRQPTRFSESGWKANREYGQVGTAPGVEDRGGTARLPLEFPGLGGGGIGPSA